MGLSAGSSAALVLAVMTCANFLNYLDRQIISILAQAIKVDLTLTDAQLGFLMGTAFAVFYSLFGIAMGRIADSVSRTRMMAIGLASWSALTALAGTATGFTALAATRAGVGIGEAAANPCSASIIAQYFPSERRAGAFGVFFSGAFLGSATAMLLGGFILQHWGSMCLHMPFASACSVAGWRAALMILGLPGIIVAIAVAFLREPARSPASELSLGRLLLTELGSALPPFTLMTVSRLGGLSALLRNLLLMLVIAACAAVGSKATGDVFQWFAGALGIYSLATWATILRLRDSRLHAHTFGSRTFLLVTASGALIATISGGVNVWAAPYAIRVLGMSPGEAGLGIGLTMTVASIFSVIIGGRLTDLWKRRDKRAPLWMGLIGMLASLLPLCGIVAARTESEFLVAFFLFSFCSTVWTGAAAALVQDLVLDNMRGTAISIYSMVSVLVASGIGPFWVGKVSTLSGSLGLGLLSIMAFVPVATIVLIVAARSLAGIAHAAAPPPGR